jgi:integrase
MVTVEVDYKRLHILRKDGKVRYVYAWRGGPRLYAEIGTPEFHAEYMAAKARRAVPDASKFRAVIVAYKSSHDWLKLAATTRRNWTRWLDRIHERFGDLPTSAFDRPDLIRKHIRQWRAEWVATSGPRAGDYGVQVLSRVLSYAIDPMGKITANPCEGIKHVYRNERADIIWTDADIATLKAVASAEVGHAVDLAALTGLRVSDLIRLSWSHVQGDTIIITTGKSRHRREAIVPVYDELRRLLASIPKRSTAILTNSRRRPWTADGLNSSFTAAMVECGLKDRDLHFHDLRGTAATKFYVAGLSERVIAEIMGWEEAAVARIIRRYVSRDAATKAVIRQLDEAKRETTEKAAVERVDAYQVSDTAHSHAIAAMISGCGVYFIRGETSGRIKIGRAANAVGRIMELSIGASEVLTLAAVIPGTHKDEQFLHAWFSACRVKGEWFDPNQILTDLVSALASNPNLDWKIWLADRKKSMEDRRPSNVVRIER